MTSLSDVEAAIANLERQLSEQRTAFQEWKAKNSRNQEQTKEYKDYVNSFTDWEMQVATKLEKLIQQRHLLQDSGGRPTAGPIDVDAALREQLARLSVAEWIMVLMRAATKDATLLPAVLNAYKEATAPVAAAPASYAFARAAAPAPVQVVYPILSNPSGPPPSLLSLPTLPPPSTYGYGAARSDLFPAAPKVELIPSTRIAGGLATVGSTATTTVGAAAPQPADPTLAAWEAALAAKPKPTAGGLGATNSSGGNSATAATTTMPFIDFSQAN